MTRLLRQIEDGDGQAAQQLLPLVYDELRSLAAAKMGREKSGHTLQSTALVHEAFLRLVDRRKPLTFQGRSHFFAAAAEAMRRILVESARSKRSERRGGGLSRRELLDGDAVVAPPSDDILDLDDALQRLGRTDATAAKLVEMRVFAGMTIPEAAEYLHLSVHQAKRTWAYARVWLRRDITKNSNVAE